LPSEKPPRRLQDIIDNARAIFTYTEGMDLAAFEEDRKTYDAVERCLERISEAAAKLGDLAPVLMPDQPWQKSGPSETCCGMSMTQSAKTRSLKSRQRTFPVCARPLPKRCACGIYKRLHNGANSPQPAKSRR
jgi:hypothetical protein